MPWSNGLEINYTGPRGAGARGRPVVALLESRTSRELSRLVAKRTSRAELMLEALRTDVAVAAIGATSEAILRLHGLTASMVPEQPKMRPLVRSLRIYVERRNEQPSREALQLLPPIASEPN